MAPAFRSRALISAMAIATKREGDGFDYTEPTSLDTTSAKSVSDACGFSRPSIAPTISAESGLTAGSKRRTTHGCFIDDSRTIMNIWDRIGEVADLRL